MTAYQAKIKDLLTRMMAARENSGEIGDPHSGEELDSLPGIMTLLPGHYRPLSPMLKQRFLQMGRWSDAHLSQDWLDISEVNRWPTIAPILRRLELRKENWDFIPPGSESAENCSVFAVNPFELDETYLLWTQEQEEPQVWEYFGADFKMFLNLERYIEYILGDRQSDDAQRDNWDDSRD